ncbi:MAG: hypothetical protein ACKORB_02305 [Opitutia bacterium]
MSVRLLLPLLLAARACAADLAPPPLVKGPPQAGRRVSVTAPEYAGTEVHHLLALPDDWTPDWKARGKSWPVIAEYTGNYAPTLGSSGEIEGASLGYGLTRGRAIWVVLPYVSADGKSNQRTWWGDAEATAAYAKTNVPRVCREFGGDADRVVLCGFSRGAIAISFIGLRDDEIARLWRACWAHDHFDGVSEWKGHAWGSPLARYREESAARLKRLNGRPLLVSQGHAGVATRKFLEPIAPEGVTYLTVDMAALYGKFPNDAAIHPHTDRWPLRESKWKAEAEAWLDKALR